MTSYLLLRNNKESGPFSLEQLISHGLKAYDLIWVNGKSAAWRYPGEIPELVQFAPAVEEQPYDRFFKKPSEEKKEEIPVRQKEIVPELVAPVEIEEKKKTVQETIIPAEEKPKEYAAAKTETPAFSPKKSVFVTMPGRSLNQEEPPVEKEACTGLYTLPAFPTRDQDTSTNDGQYHSHFLCSLQQKSFVRNLLTALLQGFHIHFLDLIKRL